MAASISLKDSSVARGAPDYLTGLDFSPGHTIVMYVAGQFAGIIPSGPFTITPYAGLSQDLIMPSNTSAAAGKTVTAVDNTNGTTATTTVTLT